MIIKQIDWLAPAGTENFNIYPIGDVHLGASNCAEPHFRNYVDVIRKDKNAKWFGGGDLIDAVIWADRKRWDASNVPPWLGGKPISVIKKSLKDTVKAQIDRLVEILDPIKDKCIGLIEGNHEYTMVHYHNRDVLGTLCDDLKVDDLTDCCFIRFKLKRYTKSNNDTAVITMRGLHGRGGGRTAGAEPNQLQRLAQETDAEFVFRGHSHTFCIAPPVPRLMVPRQGALTDHAKSHIVRAANWGCFLLSYAPGDSTYDSRAQYPARPLMTFKATVKPWTKVDKDKTKMIYKLEEVELD
ncbi:hypothetical protein ACFLQL_00720 [Verrucomicrobiota bacterium]